jgi:CRISPR/Cas system-associated endoribonuclease Cas2
MDGVVNRAVVVVYDVSDDRCRARARQAISNTF